MSEALFFRLATERDKVEALQSAVSQVNAGGAPAGAVFSADPETFSQIPGSPFAYWASERIRRLFRELPPFESEGRTVRQGLATADDFRFVRAWWEVDPAKILTGTPETTPEEFREATFKGKKWVPFAKGGEYSPYYADLHLVVNWASDGEEMNAFSGSVIRNPRFYFRPGLTYTNSTTSRLSTRCLPSGAVFSNMGPSCFFAGKNDALYHLGLMNSSVFQVLLDFQVALADTGRRHYEVGLVRQTPVPAGSGADVQSMRELALAAVLERARDACGDETTHLFSGHWAAVDPRLGEAYSHAPPQDSCPALGISSASLRLYGGPTDQPVSLDCPDSAPSAASPILASEVRSGQRAPRRSGIDETASYALGCLFGRWAVRLATGVRAMPQLPDPFDPLPVCSPGMLTRADGLPATPADVPTDYPIPIQWDGIIPDDEGHSSDLVALLRRVFASVVPERNPLETEAEVCGALKAQSLRAWFTEDFFLYHLKQYSKSRRKAPIYWQLRSASKSYSIWLYYHRMTGDTLWKVLSDYVEPKIEHERRMLGELESKVAKARAAGSGPQEREVGREIERQKALLAELAQFRADIREVAEMGYEPDRDDGVIINIAPLHKLVPWPEAAVMWKELLEGKYPWSTMSTRIREWQAKSK
jgi:hypothetical protein